MLLLKYKNTGLGHRKLKQRSDVNAKTSLCRFWAGCPANENLVAPGLVIFDKSFNDEKAFLRSISTTEKANTRENLEIGSNTVEPVQQTRSGCAQQC